VSFRRRLAAADHCRTESGAPSDSRMLVPAGV
jgi:hypothetical protein